MAKCASCGWSEAGFKSRLCDECRNPTRIHYRVLALRDVLLPGADNALPSAEVVARIRNANPPYIKHRPSYTKIVRDDVNRIVFDARKRGIPVGVIPGKGYFLMEDAEDLQAVLDYLQKERADLDEREKLIIESFSAGRKSALSP